MFRKVIQCVVEQIQGLQVQWRYSDATVMLQWRYSGATVVRTLYTRRAHMFIPNCFP